MKWDDIAKRLPGRSSISCRLRYQNYLEKRAIWDEEKKNKLARLYARYVHCSWNNWSCFVTPDGGHIFGHFCLSLLAPIACMGRS
jgi:hypothetical protein